MNSRLPEAQVELVQSELFHYTSLGGLIGIVETNSFHASNIDFLNDRKEIVYSQELIRTAVIEEFAQRFRELQNSGLMSSDFDMHQVCQAETDSFLRILNRVSKKYSPIFICSFCRANNKYTAQNGLLSQWRGYGDGGVAIVFEEADIQSLLKHQSGKYQLATTSIDDVIYGSDSPRFLELKDDLDLFRKAVPTLIEHIISKRIKQNIQFEGDKVSIDDLYLPYARRMPFLKHPSFSEEREVRIVSAVARNGFHKNKKLAKKPILFKQRQNYLLPYIELKSKGRLPIKRIIIGPSAEPDRRMASVELFLKESGYNIDVTLSDIPYA